MGCSFNLRHQVSELEDARLTVLPEYLDGAVIFFDHFAPSLIKNPDYSVAYLQSFGFLRLHLMGNAPVTLYRAFSSWKAPMLGSHFCLSVLVTAFRSSRYRQFRTRGGPPFLFCFLFLYMPPRAGATGASTRCLRHTRERQERAIGDLTRAPALQHWSTS